MTDLNPPTMIAEAEKLTPMIRRAADALAKATTASEISDVVDQAALVYDAAKVSSSFLKKQAAQVEVIAACHQAMGDAMNIKARAQFRLADEYEAAQARGELATQSHGGANIPHGVPNENTVPLTSSDVGLSRKMMHEARIVRDAERAEPGIVAKTIDAILQKGEAPQYADVKRAMRKVLAVEQAKKYPPVTPAPPPPMRQPFTASPTKSDMIEDDRRAHNELLQRKRQQALEAANAAVKQSDDLYEEIWAETRADLPEEIVELDTIKLNRFRVAYLEACLAMHIADCEIACSNASGEEQAYMSGFLSGMLEHQIEQLKNCHEELEAMISGSVDDD